MYGIQTYDTTSQISEVLFPICPCAIRVKLCNIDTLSVIIIDKFSVFYSTCNL